MAAFSIIVIGGSSSNLEYDCLSSCEYTNGIYKEFCQDNFKFPPTNEARRSPSVFTSNSNLIVVGGCEKQGVHLNSICLLKKQAKIKKNRWIEASSHLKPNFSCAASCQLQNGTFFVAGGYNEFECLNDLHLINYNKVDNNFSIVTLDNLPTNLKNSAAVEIPSHTNSQQKVLLIGGWDGKRTLKTIFECNIFENNAKCELKSVMPISIEGHTVTKITSNCYDALICGGFDGLGVVGSIYKYTFKTSKMELCIEEKLVVPRENHVSFCVWEKNKQFFIVCGGWDGFNALSNCEVFEIYGEKSVLKRIKDHKLNLTAPRNRPAGVVMTHE